MREIKFRAWDTVFKKFLGPKDGVFIRGDGRVIELEFQGFYEPSDRYEIQQYTGLKDKNGKDIYEGDIVSHHSPGGMCCGQMTEPYDTPEEVKWEVEFGDDQAEWTGFGLTWPSTFYKVIGNIYENPELLEKK